MLQMVEGISFCPSIFKDDKGLRHGSMGVVGPPLDEMLPGHNQADVAGSSETWVTRQECSLTQ